MVKVLCAYWIGSFVCSWVFTFLLFECGLELVWEYRVLKFQQKQLPEFFVDKKYHGRRPKSTQETRWGDGEVHALFHDWVKINMEEWITISKSTQWKNFCLNTDIDVSNPKVCFEDRLFDQTLDPEDLGGLKQDELSEHYINEEIPQCGLEKTFWMVIQAKIVEEL